MIKNRIGTRPGTSGIGIKLMHMISFMLLINVIFSCHVMGQDGPCTWCPFNPGDANISNYNVPPEEKKLTTPSFEPQNNIIVNPNVPQCMANVPLDTPIITPAPYCSIPIKSIRNDAPQYFQLGTTVVHWTFTDIYKRNFIVSQNVIVNNNMLLNTIPSDPTCFGINNGSIQVIPSGGSSPYSFLWNNGQTTQAVTGLHDGTFTVTVTDLYGCTSNAIANLSMPQLLIVNPLVIANVSSCGGSNGSASANATGGTPPLQYLCSDNSHQTTSTATNLIAGTYSVTVLDARGCSASGNVTITQGIPEICGNGIDDNCNGQIDEGCNGNNVTLDVKMYIEGYYSGSGIMNFSGTGGCLFINGISNTPTDADSVFISVMDPTTYTEVNRRPGILKTNGAVSVTFGAEVVVGNAYYIKVKHRNAIETWSAGPVTVNANTFYDFTTAPTKAYGNNMTETFDHMGWAFYSGDISDATTLFVGLQDGVVESQDYGDMENAVNSILIGYVTEDITGDGVVESTDYSIMENNVGAIIISMHP